MFLAYPMRFTRISSPFGRRFHPILHRWRMHDGIDFVNRVGTPIHTVADGKVIYKGWLGGYGKAVKVKHRDGYITVYGHMKGFGHIRRGQYIKQGTIIGYMGNTGLSTGPHLHFGVMHYGKWINPVKIKNRYYEIDAYKYTDGRYYDSNGKSLKGMFLAYPMRFTRISSPFGRRFHPILHKWRMHDGIDYVNKIGTPIHSVADGKVIYKGWLGGYGKAVKIRHRNGYVTIYAHMKSYGKIRLGQYIPQGKVIGYMGNTGLSTGPHLHFGVMHNGKWINPVKIKKSAKVRLYGKRKKQFLAYVDKIQQKINQKVAMK
jgi:murein DD-endopeptidase MepM/ murein hydrolase activator NlpD